MKQTIKQILRFGIVGGLAFIIDYSLLYLLTEVFQIHYLTSSIISFSVSVVFNYIASVNWVFNVDRQGNPSQVFVVFLVLSVVGLGINQLIMWAGVEKMNAYYMVTKLVATFIVMCFNFISRKYILEEKVNG